MSNIVHKTWNHLQLIIHGFIGHCHRHSHAQARARPGPGPGPCPWVAYTRRQINQDRMIFGDFSVNSKLIFLKFCKGYFLFKS